MNPSPPADHFARLYARMPDRRDLATSDHEARKHAATLGALGGRRYRSAVEIGCSIGTLTERLAPFCDALLGIGDVEAPLLEARARCAGMQRVRFAQMVVPQAWPEGEFDLIVLSEVLYFLSIEGLHTLAQRCEYGASVTATILLVNRLDRTDRVLSGEAAALTFLQLLGDGWACDNVAITARYRIDVAHRAGERLR